LHAQLGHRIIEKAGAKVAGGAWWWKKLAEK
jgi:hypothetical protein